MDGFWSALWQAIIYRTIWAWAVVGIISGAIGLVLDYTLWRKPRWENKLKWLKATPFIVFGILLLFSLSIAMPYNIWLADQNKLQDEIQKNVELTKQISAITKLNIVSLPIKEPRVNAPDRATVTITVTPDFNPPYSSIIPEEIQNPDPNNHIFEIIRFKISPADFKFTYIDPSKLPANISILDEYSGTNNVIVIINDCSPLDSKIIDFPVYTMNSAPSIRGTEILSLEILDSKVLP